MAVPAVQRMIEDDTDSDEKHVVDFLATTTSGHHGPWTCRLRAAIVANGIAIEANDIAGALGMFAALAPHGCGRGVRHPHPWFVHELLRHVTDRCRRVLSESWNPKRCRSSSAVGAATAEAAREWVPLYRGSIRLKDAGPPSRRRSAGLARPNRNRSAHIGLDVSIRSA